MNTILFGTPKEIKSTVERISSEKVHPLLLAETLRDIQTNSAFLFSEMILFLDYDDYKKEKSKEFINTIMDHINEDEFTLIIIDNFELIPKFFQSKIRIIMEECSEKVNFIICCNNREAITKAIRSRCFEFDCNNTPKEYIKKSFNITTAKLHRINEKICAYNVVNRLKKGSN